LTTVVLLVGATGCAQVLGLDAYGPAGDDAAAGSDGSADSYAADHTVDAQSPGDAPLDQSEGGGDDVVVDDTGAADSQGTMDAPGDTASGDDAADSSADVVDAGFDSGGCGTGTICAPAVPGGWTGPVALWAGTATMPPCAAGFNPLFDGGSPSTAPAQCTCTCSAPGGATCGAAQIRFTKNCHQNCGSAQLAPGSCTNLDPFDTSCMQSMTMPVGFTANGSTASGGTCNPNGSTSLPSVWGGYAVACTPSSPATMGCGVGGLCTQIPASPFDYRPCIYRQSDTGCPGGGYSVQHVYYDGVQEGRGCSGCMCGGASGVDCNSLGHVELWGTTDCTDAGIVDLTPLPSGCAAPTGAHGATFTTTATGGTCPAVGGQPMGSVTGQNPITFCCTP
jgi:hypothetical protein